MMELTDEDREELNAADKIELFITSQTSTVITRRAIDRIGGQDLQASDIMQRLIETGCVIRTSGGTFDGIDYPKRYFLNANLADQYRMFCQGGFPLFPAMGTIDIWWNFA
jgi:hypothetical protein